MEKKYRLHPRQKYWIKCLLQKGRRIRLTPKGYLLITPAGCAVYGRKMDPRTVNSLKRFLRRKTTYWRCWGFKVEWVIDLRKIEKAPRRSWIFKYVFGGKGKVKGP